VGLRNLTVGQHLLDRVTRRVYNSMADIFDVTLAVEEAAAAEGRARGLLAGSAEGATEGRELGFAKGHELAAEMGYYKGCCATWLAMHELEAKEPGRAPRLAKLSEKALASMAALVDMAAAVPRENTGDTDLLASVQSCRAKFKAITAMLHADVRFDPRAEAAAKDMSF
jgi:Essential protein Yae1, N terminal